VICEEACRIIGADQSHVFRIRQSGSLQREVLYSHNIPQDFIDLLLADRAGSLVVDVFKTQQMEIFSEPEVRLKKFAPDDVRRFGIRTVCAIPIIVEGNSYAALVLHHFVERDYSAEDRQLAEAFGDLASIAVEKARLVESLESRVAEGEGLVSALGKITSGKDVNEIIQEVLAGSRPLMGTDRCAIMLPDEASGVLRLFASRGISSEFVENLSKLPRPFPIGQSYLSNSSLDEPSIVPDATANLEYGPVQAREGHRTMAAFPLRLEEKNIGALFFFWTTPQELEGQRISLGRAIADQAAIVLENTRLHKATEERAARLEVIGNIAKIAASSLEPDDIFRSISVEICRAVPCDQFVMAEFDWEKQVYNKFHEVSNQPTGVPSADRVSIGILAETVYQPKKPLYVPDLLDSPWSKNPLVGFGFRSVLVIPIHQDGRPMVISPSQSIPWPSGAPSRRCSASWPRQSPLEKPALPAVWDL